MHRPHRFLAIGATALILLLSACGGTGGSASGNLTHLRLQLQWVPQAQFAGYFAAEQQGYYARRGPQRRRSCPAARTSSPQVEGSEPNGPEFTIAWVPKVLEARESKGQSDLVDIAQVFQRSGTRSVSWKDSDITSPADSPGKKVGVWDFGNELRGHRRRACRPDAAAREQRHRLQPEGHPAFDMTLLAQQQIDVAEAMIYNEYAQVLEAKNPDTGELYQPEDLNVINYNDDRHRDAPGRALWRAPRGWPRPATRTWRSASCAPRSRAGCTAATTRTTASSTSTDAGSHARRRPPDVDDERDQRRSSGRRPTGIGELSADAWSQTVQIALAADIIAAAPDASAYRTDLAEKAVGRASAAIGTAPAGTKATVEITAGGE